MTSYFIMACQIEKKIFLTHLAPHSASAFGFLENVGQSHDGPLFLRIMALRFSIFEQKMLMSANLWKPLDKIVYFFKSCHGALPLNQVSCFWHIPIQRYLAQARHSRTQKITGLVGLRLCYFLLHS